jgi:hypothetical protein
MSVGTKFAVDIALQCVLIFLFLGSLFSIVYGVSLSLRQHWVHALNERMKHWVSSREALRPLALPRDVDSFVHRWHLWIGLLMVLGSGFVLYAAFFRYEAAAVTALFQPSASLFAPMLVQIFWWILVLGGIAGLALGIVLIARPELLRAIEEWGNRSYSERRALKPMEEMNFAVDQMAMTSPRLYGGLIALGGLYAALVLGYFLLTGM